MPKSLLWILISVGGLLGGLVPTWLGASYLSAWGILGSGIGALAGVYIFNRLDF